MARWLRNGLIISDGDNLWKKHRKIITPSFHVEVLREFIKIFEFNTKILIKKLETELDKPSFNIQPYISLCSLDIICGTTMGTSVQAQEYSHSNYVQSVKFMCNVFTRRSFHPLYTIDFCYKFSKLYREEKRALHILHTYTKEVIAKRKMEYKTNKNNLGDGIEKQPKKVLLDLLLEQNEISKTFTDEEIDEELITAIYRLVLVQEIALVI
ncbi:hypothetical protein FQR65_LT11027 [Abscondita terminalis]|nr:hypothetical protein FQR65_LT11027 [Abscondita terminalis]